MVFDRFIGEEDTALRQRIKGAGTRAMAVLFDKAA
jgi:hypothetical protein